MKPDTFAFDRHLFDLLRQPQHAQFTTRDLREAYAGYLDPGSFRLSDLRRYVYEQIRRLLRAGWIARDEEHRQRGQVYHLLETTASIWFLWVVASPRFPRQLTLQPKPHQ